MYHKRKCNKLRNEYIVEETPLDCNNEGQEQDLIKEVSSIVIHYDK